LRALILTAGLGMRLRPLTYVRAKAAVPVNGEPIVRRVIAWLVREGVADLVLNLHHDPASIGAVVGDGADLGARVRYSWESPVLGSAGGPRRALPLLLDRHSPGSPMSGRSQSSDSGQETPSPGAVLIVNGDTLTDLRVSDMMEAHRSSGASVTMALTPNPRPDIYGGVLVNNGRVTGFSRRGAARESFHFIGVQIAEAKAFADLEDGVPAESVMQLYPQLIRDNAAAIAAHMVDAPFSDVGTPADYLQTSLELAAVEGDHLISTRGVAIDPSAEVHGTAVWDDVTIGAKSHLEECIVCDRVQLPQGSHYRRCAIVPSRGEAPREGERLEGGVLIKSF
jgi:NDP-sugar pyrophosphorylase family protein